MNRRSNIRFHKIFYSKYFRIINIEVNTDYVKLKSREEGEGGKYSGEKSAKFSINILREGRFQRTGWNQIARTYFQRKAIQFGQIREFCS